MLEVAADHRHVNLDQEDRTVVSPTMAEENRLQKARVMPTKADRVANVSVMGVVIWTSPRRHLMGSARTMPKTPFLSGVPTAGEEERVKVTF